MRFGLKSHLLSTKLQSRTHSKINLYSRIPRLETTKTLQNSHVFSNTTWAKVVLGMPIQMGYRRSHAVSNEHGATTTSLILGLLLKNGGTV